MRQPRTDRLPVPPPAFQQSTHKNQSTSFLPNFPEFCKCKTVSISCQNSANFIRLSGAGRPRGALAPCLVPFRPDLLRPKTCSALSPFGAKNNDTQILCLLCAVLRYFLNTQVSYHVFRLMSKLEIFHLCIKIFVCFFENQLL